MRKNQKIKSEDDVSMGYNGLNRFTVNIGAKNFEDSMLLILNRDGFFSWKLVGINFIGNFFNK